MSPDNQVIWIFDAMLVPFGSSTLMELLEHVHVVELLEHVRANSVNSSSAIQIPFYTYFPGKNLLLYIYVVKYTVILIVLLNHVAIAHK